MRPCRRLPWRSSSPADTSRSRPATGATHATRFQEATDLTDSPEALDGLGRALWWLRDERGAVVHRERAYAGFRRDGELARAARIALWLSREYLLAFDNDAASRGWLARAERLLRDVAPGAERAGSTSRAPRRRATRGDRSLASPPRLSTSLSLTGDMDLELRALAQLGLAEVTLGETDRGLARLDEAMAAATSGEPATLETFADICCTLMLACERAGDSERPQQWSAVLDEFVRAHDHVTLLAFCRTCCADVYAANGRIDSAEAELELAVRELSAAGQRSRCIPPSARLAEIRVLQGRFDEAEQLLDGLEAEPEALQAVSLSASPRRARRRLGALDAPARRARVDESARCAAARAARRGAAARGLPRRRYGRGLRARGDRGRARSRARGGARDRVSRSHRLRRRAGGRRRAPARGGEPLRGARFAPRRGADSPRTGPRARCALAGGRRRHGTTRAHRARGARRASRCRRRRGAHALAGREGPRRADGRWGYSAGARRRCSGSSATASRIARSPSGCSSARRPRSTTSVASTRSSA